MVRFALSNTVTDPSPVPFGLGSLHPSVQA